MRFSVVDAFTDRPFRGNPAGVVILDEPAPEEWMQHVAAELNLSETAYCQATEDPARWGLRWFTPATEVALCGHATLAAAHVLWRDGRAPADAPLTFDTRSGPLGAAPDGERIVLDFPSRPPADVPAPDGLDAVLPAARYVGVTNDAEWLERNAVVELDGPGALRSAAPDLAALRAVRVGGLIVTSAGDGDADYLLRYFAPTVGIAEDPVTGSAHVTAGPYWAERLGRDSLRAVQASARGGDMDVTVRGDRVLLAGHAVRTIVGELPEP